MRPVKHVATRRSLGNERGLALIITLFVVALVAVLVLEYHFDASVELDLAANYANDVQAYHLALAGVRFAQAVLQQDDPRADGPDDVWYRLGLLPACFAPQQLLALAALGTGEGPAAGGSDAKAAALTDRLLADASTGDVGCVRLRITDEDSKLPINGLMPQPPTATGTGGTPTPPPTNPWVQIFKTFFARFLQTDPETVEALIDWIDTDDTPSGAAGAERSYYEHLPVPYTPPDKPMRTLGELRLVKGLENPEELAKLFPGVAPEALADLDLGSNAYLTTAWGDNPQPWNNAKVNINTALPEVLEILIEGLSGGTGGGGVKAKVQEIMAQRQEKQFTTLPNVGVSNLNTVADVKSTYFRVESIGVMGNVHKKIVAVLKRAPSAVARLPGGAPPRTQQPTQPMTMLNFKVE